MSDKAVKIVKMDICSLLVPVKGLTPIMLNRFTEEAIGQIEAGQQGEGRRGKQPRNPEKEFLAHRHINEDGDHCIPGGAFKQACMRVAKGLGYSMVDFACAFFVDAHLVPMTSNEPVMDRQPVKPNFKTTTIAYRPRYDDWSAILPVSFDTSQLTQQEVLTILEKAGWAVGVGAHRPEKKGINGRFDIDHTKSIIVIDRENEDWDIVDGTKEA